MTATATATSLQLFCNFSSVSFSENEKLQAATHLQKTIAVASCTPFNRVQLCNHAAKHLSRRRVQLFNSLIQNFIFTLIVFCKKIWGKGKISTKRNFVRSDPLHNLPLNQFVFCDEVEVK